MNQGSHDYGAQPTWPRVRVQRCAFWPAFGLFSGCQAESHFSLLNEIFARAALIFIVSFMACWTHYIASGPQASLPWLDEAFWAMPIALFLAEGAITNIGYSLVCRSRVVSEATLDPGAAQAWRRSRSVVRPVAKVPSASLSMQGM